MELMPIKTALQASFGWQALDIERLGGQNSYFNATFRLTVADKHYALQCVPQQSTVFAKDAHRQLPLILSALNQPACRAWYPYTQLQLQPTIAGDFYIPLDLAGQAVELRVFDWIDSEPVTTVDGDIAFAAGKILADFHMSVHEIPGLSALAADTIEPLPHFHDSAWYLQQWDDALHTGRWSIEPGALNEHMALINNGRALIGAFDAFRQQQLQQQPRLMHGDPKLANILFRAGQAVALIDFDTIMTGLWHYDVADAVRSLCNNQAENGDPDLVGLNLLLFKRFMQGYAPALLCWHDGEREMLLAALALLPLELGIRFLFGCHRQHPLRLESDPVQAAAKALVQLRLFADIQRQTPALADIISTLMPKRLQAHPAHTATTPTGLEITTAVRHSGSELEVFYRLSSHLPLSATLAPPPLLTTPQGQAKGLWRHTCLEAFVSHPGDRAYVEFNGSPNQQSDVFIFQDERRNAEGLTTSDDILPSCSRTAEWQWFYQQHEQQALAKWQVQLASLEGITPTQAIEYNITAVIELTTGEYCYLALTHCRPAPDFHARAALAFKTHYVDV